MHMKRMNESEGKRIIAPLIHLALIQFSKKRKVLNFYQMEPKKRVSLFYGQKHYPKLIYGTRFKSTA